MALNCPEIWHLLSLLCSVSIVETICSTVPWNSGPIRDNKNKLEAPSFPRASLSENCSLLGTDNVRGQISEHIFAPNEGYCLFMHEAAIIAVLEFTVRSTRFKNLRKRPFHLPNIFSADIRALLRRKLKCLWKFWEVWFSGYPFFNHLSSGYAGSPRITSFISRPSKLLGYCRQIVTPAVHDSKGLSLTELVRLAGTLQGHPTTMSRNKYLASTYACITTLWNDFRVT